MARITNLRDIATNWDTIHSVLCHGCFDLLHIGHVRHFQAAKKLVEAFIGPTRRRLVVTITPDRFVNKGPGRPVFPEALRAEMVAAMECVDLVAINEYPTAVEAIKLLKPAVYCKGADTRFNECQALRDEIAAIASVGGQMVFTEELTYHSSELLGMVQRTAEEDAYAAAAH